MSYHRLMKYKFAYSEAKTVHKYGVDISLYSLGQSAFNIVYESVDKGHFEEFYSDVSTFTWFIIEGKGTFVLNDEKVEASAKDIITVPPKTRIHYFGQMKMILITTPAYDAKNEHHVREVDASESPYK